MKLGLAIVLLSVTAASGACAGGSAEAAQDVFVTEAAVTYGAAPDSMPPGAKAAVIYGDPGKRGEFVVRLKLPKGYRFPAHTHPGTEIVTVLSGLLQVGKSATPGAAPVTMPPGSLIVLGPTTAHYAVAVEDTVIQVNGTGPFGVTYVNPSDDPRRAAAN